MNNHLFIYVLFLSLSLYLLYFIDILVETNSLKMIQPKLPGYSVEYLDMATSPITNLENKDTNTNKLFLF